MKLLKEHNPIQPCVLDKSGRMVVMLISLNSLSRVLIRPKKIKFKAVLFIKHSFYDILSYVSRHQKLKNKLVFIAKKTHLHTRLSSISARVSASRNSSRDSIDALYKKEELSLYAKEIYKQLTEKYKP
ncbi:hypothetical protein ACL2XO_18520 [Sodalis sp. RH15]|uniref:hypothetical protein n=1 Tax=Sodalis sp. RH15 TaxID=3394330 RepID=UPI0039B5222D